MAYIDSNLVNYIVTFLICWYPFFIIVATFEVLIYKFLYRVKYNEEFNIHTVEFVYNSRRKSRYNVSNESYRFICTDNGRVKRFRSPEEKSNRKYKFAACNIFYIGLIFVFGAISTINFGYGNSAYIKSAIYVTFAYIIMWTSLLIIYKPIEIMAKEYIKRNILPYNNK